MKSTVRRLGLFLINGTDQLLEDRVVNLPVDVELNEKDGFVNAPCPRTAPRPRRRRASHVVKLEINNMAWSSLRPSRLPRATPTLSPAGRILSGAGRPSRVRVRSIVGREGLKDRRADLEVWIHPVLDSSHACVTANDSNAVVMSLLSLTPRTLHGTKYRTTATPWPDACPGPPKGDTLTQKEATTSSIDQPSSDERLLTSHHTSQQQPLIGERADKERRSKGGRRRAEQERATTKFAERGQGLSSRTTRERTTKHHDYHDTRTTLSYIIHISSRRRRVAADMVTVGFVARPRLKLGELSENEVAQAPKRSSNSNR